MRDLEKTTNLHSKNLIRPRVGIGVLVFNDDKILLGKRINSHGASTWSSPGGHLEFGENPKNCAFRELQEETNLIAEKIIKGPWTNDFFEDENKHYVTLFMIVTRFNKNPIVKEPEKCLEWTWFEPNHLPSPLFVPLKNLLKICPLSSLMAHSDRKQKSEKVGFEPTVRY